MPDSQVNDTEQKVENPQSADESKEAEKVEPTRYGDWEKNGRCVDF